MGMLKDDKLLQMVIIHLNSHAKSQPSNVDQTEVTIFEVLGNAVWRLDGELAGKLLDGLRYPPVPDNREYYHWREHVMELGGVDLIRALLCTRPNNVHMKFFNGRHLSKLARGANCLS